jgi:predicted nucleic acid-binding protein
MKTIFADTFYWVALINNRDNWHHQVVSKTRQLQQVRILTTDEVFIEVLNNLAGYGTSVRQRTLHLIEGLQKNPNLMILPQSHQSFELGLELYKQRSDKGYSLTDCISMQVMKQRNITEVLTHDKHFTQEGFMILF